MVTVKHGPHIPSQELAVPGFPSLCLKVFGKENARGLEESMAQGFTIYKAKVPTARAELPGDERAAVESLIRAQFPEHARLL